MLNVKIVVNAYLAQFKLPYHCSQHRYKFEDTLSQMVSRITANTMTKRKKGENTNYGIQQITC